MSPKAPDVNKKISFNKLEQKKTLFEFYHDNYGSIEKAKKFFYDEGKSSRFASACNTICYYYLNSVEKLSHDDVIKRSVEIWDTIRESLKKDAEVRDPTLFNTIEHLMFYVFASCKIFIEPKYDYR